MKLILLIITAALLMLAAYNCDRWLDYMAIQSQPQQQEQRL